MFTALRSLRRHPARTLLVIVTLALGLGATASIVSAIYGVLLAPLPYPEPDRLVTVREMEEGEDFGTVGWETFDDWRRSARSFASMGALGSRSYILMSGGEAEQLQVLGTTHGAFETFGVRPLMGRTISPSDDKRGAPRVLVLSYELWSRRFGRDRAILGRTVRLSDMDFEVIGVMPPRLRMREPEWRTEHVDAWTAMRYDATLPYACRSCRHLRVYARLRDGISADAAAREVETLTAGLRRAHPDVYPTRGWTAVTSLQETVVGRQVASSLWTVLGIALLVLVAAIANAGSLRLAELYRRRNEITVRQSLGASQWRVALMLIGESLAQALLASILGTAIAVAGVTWLRARAGAFLPRAADLAVDPFVVAVCVAVATFAGVVIGLIPAWRARRWALVPASRGVVGSRSAAQKVLAGVNIALSVVLLAGTMLILRSVQKLFATPPGFDGTNVVSFRVSVGGSRYEEASALFALYDRFLREGHQLAGVERMALTTQLPFAEDRDNASMHAEDRVGREAVADAPNAQRFGITPGYFATLRIPVKAGRAFTRNEREPVVILNETAARTLWPAGVVLGKRVRIGGGDNPFLTVVGVVGDVAPGELGATKRAQAYLPLEQFADSEVTGIARTTGPATAIRELMRRLDPDVAFFRVASLESLIAASEARRMFILACLSAFSVVAFALAMIGVYGVLALHVSSRTREIGLRMALGSTGRGVFRLIVAQGLRLVGVAMLAGLAAAVLLGRFLEAMLYRVGSGDPLSLLAVVFLLGLASAIACAVPAWRAARVSPMQALHVE